MNQLLGSLHSPSAKASCSKKLQQECYIQDKKPRIDESIGRTRARRHDVDAQYVRNRSPQEKLKERGRAPIRSSMSNATSPMK